MRLKDKVAFVTGGGQGIGRAIALSFAREGADVAMAAPNREDMERVCAEIRGLGRRASHWHLDLRGAQDLEALREDVLGAFGRVDILINNSGIPGVTAAVHELNEADWDEVMNINLKGMYRVSKAFLPPMIARKQGSVINMASLVGQFGYPLRSPYCVSKWGVIGLTLTMALELAPHGIRVNAVAPGAVSGQRLDRVFENLARARGKSPEELRAQIVRSVPLGKIVDPGEVAPACLFLASDEARMVTGEILRIAGGQGIAFA
jgi:NAD(P)-dependent dehydrogenase (short-subunit alcohol dehydrogenase family)